MTKAVRSILLFILLHTTLSYAAPAVAQTNHTKLNVSLDKFITLSCDHSGVLCVAVGFDEDDASDTLFTYRSQDAGQTWSEPTPLLKASTETNANLNIEYTRIHCNGDGQQCMIVTAAMINQSSTPLIYNTQDGGLSWSEPIELSLPSSAQQDSINYIKMDIACGDSGRSCVIVGTTYSDEQIIHLTYNTQDAGQNWALITNLPTPLCSSRPPKIALQSVHCDQSGKTCKAVGSAWTRNSFWGIHETSLKPIVYTTSDGGLHWNKPMILPSEIAKNLASNLENIACDETGMQCTALGYTHDLNSNQYQYFSYSTRDGGLSWENQRMITPGYGNEKLVALDCHATGLQCTAIGFKKMTRKRQVVFIPVVYSTMDSTQTWEKNSTTHTPSQSLLFDIFCSKTDEHCSVVGVDIL